MWLAHHHEYALLAALCNILSLSLCLSLSLSRKVVNDKQCKPLEKNRDDDGGGDAKEKMAKEKHSLVKCQAIDIGMEGRIFRH
jgi:hypothetical protein